MAFFFLLCCWAITFGGGLYTAAKKYWRPLLLLFGKHHELLPVMSNNDECYLACLSPNLIHTKFEKWDVHCKIILYPTTVSVLFWILSCWEINHRLHLNLLAEVTRFRDTSKCIVFNHTKAQMIHFPCFAVSLVVFLCMQSTFLTKCS